MRKSGLLSLNARRFFTFSQHASFSLRVSVMKAKNLMAKDANGERISDFSVTKGCIAEVSNDGSSDVDGSERVITFSQCRPRGLTGYSDPYCMLGILMGQSPREMEEKKERKFSFRKRKEKLEKRSSTKEVLPARSIQVTEVKPETLNPVWDEHFVL